VKIGMELPQTGEQASAESVALVAIEAERMGLDSVWVLDRVLRPRALAERGGPPLPASVFDPIETLAFAAAKTDRIALGTSAVIALPHPPVVLARRLATLDQLSGGRLIAGLAQGWMPEELAAGGVPTSHLGTGWDEYLGALRAVWGPDPVRFDGAFYQIPPSDIGPKPVQHELPVFMGYSTPAGLRRAARVADGLHPFQTDLATLRDHLELFRRCAAEAGRDPAALPVVLRVFASHTAPEAGTARQLLNGGLDQWLDDLEQLVKLGVDHVLVGLGAMPVDEQLHTMATLRDRL
jgi:probable F420-dependent oxidoreductase